LELMHVDLDSTHPAIWRIRLQADEAEAIRLDAEGVTALMAAVEAAETSATCRVMVLEGTGGSFCMGMDLKAVMAEPAGAVAHIHTFARCLGRLRSSSKAVVAVVDGTAAGGGVGLAAAADLVVATARATFALPEAILGLLPAVVLPVLRERLSLQKVRWLTLTSGIDAHRAMDLGLVDHLVEDPTQVEHELRPIFKHLLRTCPESVAGLKRLGDEYVGLTLDEALLRGADHTAAMVQDPARIAVLQAFLRGEATPPWFAPLGAPDRKGT
jgi:enoyl-CoA hydratase/carnithine racemase